MHTNTHSDHSHTLTPLTPSDTPTTVLHHITPHYTTRRRYIYGLVDANWKEGMTKEECKTFVKKVMA